ncbi:MAG: glycosyltransferase [Ferruginibacter sp.]
MTIAINLTNFISGASKDIVYAQFERLAIVRKEDQFVFILTKDQNRASGSISNISALISGPKTNTILLWKLWYDYTLPSLLKKCKASLLVNTDNVCSLRTKIPQCLFIADIGFINAGENFLNKYYRYVQKNAVLFFSKASVIITSTQSVQKEIVEYFKKFDEKIITAPLNISRYYQPMSWKEKEEVKEKLTEGKEYFLFSGQIDERANLVNLLKAFSFFKRRQKSNMQLLIAARQSPAANTFIESLKTYKYHNEVKVLSNLSEEEIAKLTAAAYAFVYPVWHESLPLIPLNAIHCEAPLILPGTAIFREIAGQAAIYIQPDNIEDIAQKMMLLFKDETQRNELIKTSKALAISYRQTDHADLLWKAITNSLEL